MQYPFFEKAFFGTGDLKKHISTKHKDAAKNLVSWDIKTVHEGVKSHKCENCGKTFSAI